MEGFKEEDQGLPFYRCTLCHGVVSVWDIQEKKGCPKCSCNKIKPTDLTFREKVAQIFKHPAVWRWNRAPL